MRTVQEGAGKGGWADVILGSEGHSILGEVTGPLQLGGAEVTLGHGGRKACFQGSQQDSERALSLEGGGEGTGTNVSVRGLLTPDPIRI